MTENFDAFHMFSRAKRKRKKNNNKMTGYGWQHIFYIAMDKHDY